MAANAAKSAASAQFSRPGDLVSVRWGEGAGKQFEAVVGEVSERGVRCTFDGPRENDPLNGCAVWLAASAVSALKTPIARAAHLAVGRTITARNPASVDEAWEPATVKAVRQGLKRGAPGLRVQAHFASCDLTVWLRMGDIAEPEPEPEPEPEADEEPLATQVPSGTNVHGMQPGDEVWHVDANGENRVRAEVLRVWPQPVIRVDDLEEGTRSKTTSWDRLMPILDQPEAGPPTPSSVGSAAAAAADADEEEEVMEVEAATMCRRRSTTWRTSRAATTRPPRMTRWWCGGARRAGGGARGQVARRKAVLGAV